MDLLRAQYVNKVNGKCSRANANRIFRHCNYRTHKLIKFPRFFAYIYVYMLYCICGISIDICTDCCRLPNGFQELWAWQLPPSDDECWYFSWKSWRIMANREPPARYVIAVQWCVWLISFCGLFSTFLCDYFLFLFFFANYWKSATAVEKFPQLYIAEVHFWLLLPGFSPGIFTFSTRRRVLLYTEVVAHFWTFKPLLACVQLQKLPTLVGSSCFHCSCSCLFSCSADLCARSASVGAFHVIWRVIQVAKAWELYTYQLAPDRSTSVSFVFNQRTCTKFNCQVLDCWITVLPSWLGVVGVNR